MERGRQKLKSLGLDKGGGMGGSLWSILCIGKQRKGERTRLRQAIREMCDLVKPKKSDPQPPFPFLWQEKLPINDSVVTGVIVRPEKR